MTFPTDLHNQVGNLDLDQERVVEAKELGKGIPRKSPWCPQHTTEWDHLTSQEVPKSSLNPCHFISRKFEGNDPPEVQTTTVKPSLERYLLHLYTTDPHREEPHPPLGARRCQELAQVENDETLPFHIDVTHLLPCEAEVIQDHIFRVPNNTTQEKPMCGRRRM